MALFKIWVGLGWNNAPYLNARLETYRFHNVVDLQIHDAMKFQSHGVLLIYGTKKGLYDNVKKTGAENKRDKYNPQAAAQVSRVEVLTWIKILCNIGWMKAI